ncbi:alpha/beta hydrolase family protein [Chitinophaga rhizophila]|uniref:Prolyl oligopeptidase family serine peptidase n=1 Tax=Chitinophaga rhizophila TaxID=2866212 RepID=A0ABS7G6N4_9BACT|nr:prolyl oligopeptidase family serine peptidase [Chitinophaga rhizophila]MBW8683041.1 prolyl oligopeptidase family serine peptidase [Chitinophaga rhizophila]
MRYLIICLFYSLFQPVLLSGQKRPINDTTYKNWKEVRYGVISDDGEFAGYTIINEPSQKSTFVVTSTDKTWEKRFIDVSNTHFSSDGKYLFGIRQDSLLRQKLRSDIFTILPYCSNYSLVSKNRSEWLVYKKITADNTIIIENLRTGKTNSIPGVLDFIVNNEWACILYKRKTDNDSTENLFLLDLVSGITKSIAKTANTNNFIFDKCGDRLAFTIGNTEIKRIGIYNRRDNTLKTVSDSAIAINKTFSTDFWQFTSDCRGIFFTQKEKSINKHVTSNAKFKVWNYKDAYLPGDYDAKKASIKNGQNLSVIDISSLSIRQLLQGNQKINHMPKQTDVFFVKSSYGRSIEVPWNKDLFPSYFLCHSKTGKIDTIKHQSKYEISVFGFSENNDFFVYYDTESKQYISFNCNTGKKSIIGKDIPEVPFDNIEYYDETEKIALAGINGWASNSNKVIIRGRYNIWSVDLNGKEKSTNLTSMCSSNGKTVFKLSDAESNIDLKENIPITSYDYATRATTFYTLNLKKQLCKKIFHTTDYLVEPFSYPYTRFLKAKNADKYIFVTEHSMRSSNYIFTDNFETFDTLSNVNPQLDYNWLTSEIIKYNDADGKQCEGILYKPENFDPRHKYPVIINYYLDQTTRFNKYISPEPENTGFNIPLLLNAGYLVVRPNLYIERSKPGESALKSVLAVTEYLCKQTWIDSTKLGILGHSLGGYFTNYFITNSNRFAAAISEAGVSNMIDGVTGMWGDRDSQADYYIEGPPRMMVELHNAPDAYIKNSPILSTDKVSTPLLLIHNNNDSAVPVMHSKQLFIQLRRQGLPVWLLQYEGETHIVDDEENTLDLQQKVLQFYNYLLRNEPMPQWMNMHI